MAWRVAREIVAEAPPAAAQGPRSMFTALHQCGWTCATLILINIYFKGHKIMFHCDKCKFSGDAEVYEDMDLDNDIFY